MMDAGGCAGPGCGKQLLPGRKLDAFCSYACRGQFRALEATTHRTGLKYSKNAKQNKALQSLKRQAVAGWAFARINGCTYRLDRPTKLGAGWLMEVHWPAGARQRWVARVGNRTCEPLILDEAKQAAVGMLVERRQVKPLHWIAELHRIAAAEVDRVALAKDRKQWPRDLVGGSHRGAVDHDLRKTILDAELVVMLSHAEPLSKDGFRLEFYDDGYPKLPECLRRKSHEDRLARIPTAYAA